MPAHMVLTYLHFRSLKFPLMDGDDGIHPGEAPGFYLGGVDMNLDGKGKNFYDRIMQGTPWMCTFGTICLPCLNVGYVNILT